jgi:MraZ protein
MPEAPTFLLGEFSRTLDDRYRLSIPPELAEPFTAAGLDCILAKEQPGCLSLWNAAAWQQKLEAGVQLVKAKMAAGKLEGRIEDVQRLARLLSTRHRPVQVAGRGRVSIPDGFREFLQVAQGGDVFVIGAGLSIEIWSPPAWISYVESRMPEFRRLLDGLAN